MQEEEGELATRGRRSPLFACQAGWGAPGCHHDDHDDHDHDGDHHHASCNDHEHMVAPICLMSVCGHSVCENIDLVRNGGDEGVGPVATSEVEIAAIH